MTYAVNIVRTWEKRRKGLFFDNFLAQSCASLAGPICGMRRIFPKKTTFILIAGFAAASGFYIYSASSGSIVCKGVSVPTKAMPASGANFSSYCLPCIAALRTFAREPVIDSVVAAYGDVAVSHSSTKFLYGEIGLPNGGRFRPHRTHRQGLSVDLMVPLKEGEVMQTSVRNRYGYDVEFDAQGRGEQGEIDFTALSSLIVALEKQAKMRDGKIRRIFFAPDLQPELREASSGTLSDIRFNKRQSWVRHDDHIHVDFSFPCSVG